MESYIHFDVDVEGAVKMSIFGDASDQVTAAIRAIPRIITMLQETYARADREEAVYKRGNR